MEEEKSKYFPQEIFIQQQKDRQKQPLLSQKEQFIPNLQSESPLLNKVITSDIFSDEPYSENWEISSFSQGSLEKPCDIHSDWTILDSKNDPKGLLLKNQIISLKPKIQLKSIAIQTKVNFQLIGNSTLWFISRSQNLRGPEAVICKFKKEMDSQRIFVIFGANIGKNSEFKFFKKQEIPEVYQKEEDTHMDCVDLTVRYIDNGDDRIFVKIILGKNNNIYMSCDKYIPFMQPASLMLAGSGDTVYLKTCSVKQISRIISNPNRTRFECCLVI